ncbi:MAG: GHKL domain-containing protein [Lachnospiraceae bacterium]|nr:GHKL domain-containing protein [Lachnospiraceae bacterium]
MWVILDILAYSMKGILLLYLGENAIEWKEKYKKQGKYLFFLLFVVAEIWFSNSKIVNYLLYGEEMIMKNSSSSISKLLLCIFFDFFMVDFFYQGSRLLKAYIVLLYEVIFEMARFGIYGFWNLGIGAYIEWWTNQAIDGIVSMEIYYDKIKIIEYIGIFILTILYTGIMYLTIRFIRKHFRNSTQGIHRKGILFLMIFPTIGFAFDLVLRSLLFVWNGEQVDYLFERHKGMYAIVPMMTFLCLLAIVYSIKIYGELMVAEEERNRLFFYKQQLSEMTGHVQEMERLYDGIRGMRHDMNNYIADMEQLIGVSMHQGNLEKSVENEAQNYLYRMKNAIESLTLHYNTGNPVMDVILNRKWQECVSAHITLDGDFLYSEQLGIEAFDMGILLNNALDNAIEACGRCAAEMDKKISIFSYQKGAMFFLRIENSCNGNEIVYTTKQELRTSKEDEWQHGIGLKNMKSIVERYYGTMAHEIREDTFILTIMLQEKVT